MKIKMDFVTNSSSSSFLIVDRREDKKEVIEIELSLKIPLSSLRHEKISTLEKLDENFDKHYFKNYLKIKELIEKDVPVYLAWVSSEDSSPLECCLYDNVNEYTIIVLPGSVTIANR